MSGYRLISKRKCDHLEVDTGFFQGPFLLLARKIDFSCRRKDAAPFCLLLLNNTHPFHLILDDGCLLRSIKTNCLDIVWWGHVSFTTLRPWRTPNSPPFLSLASKTFFFPAGRNTWRLFLYMILSSHTCWRMLALEYQIKNMHGPKKGCVWARKGKRNVRAKLPFVIKIVWERYSSSKNVL